LNRNKLWRIRDYAENSFFEDILGGVGNVLGAPIFALFSQASYEADNYGLSIAFGALSLSMLCSLFRIYRRQKENPLYRELSLF